MDETEKKILSMCLEGEKEAHSSIYDEYTVIGPSRYVFDWRGVVNARTHMLLPREFVELPLNIAKLRYPSESRPKEIKSSLDTTVNIAFLFQREKIPGEKYIDDAARMYAAAIHRLYPGHEFLGCGSLHRDDKQERLLSWYEYISPTFDESLYNRHGFLSVEGMLLQVIFNCPQSLAKEWRPVCMEMFLSIRNDLETAI